VAAGAGAAATVAVAEAAEGTENVAVPA
jgi:hypothetical protein